MILRNVNEQDYQTVIGVINDWWNGRQMADMLPKLFFMHFKGTSFVIEHNNKIVAFLVGFISQSCPDEAYIHFIGVDPKFRQKNIAKRLYDKFFDVIKEKGCNTVKSVTSPVNDISIKFHQKMGFHIEKCGDAVGGIPIYKDYDGPGQDRVLFVKTISN